MSLRAGTLEWIPDASHPQPGTGLTASSSNGVLTGSSSPEGLVAAEPGTIFQLIVNGLLVATYVKVTGSGNTGWQ